MKDYLNRQKNLWLRILREQLDVLSRLDDVDNHWSNQSQSKFFYHTLSMFLCVAKCVKFLLS